MSDNAHNKRSTAGTDPKVEEGRGGDIDWDWCGPAACAVRGIFSLQTYNVNAQCARKVWGHAPLRKLIF